MVCITIGDVGLGFAVINAPVHAQTDKHPLDVIFVHEVKKDGFVFWVGVNGGKEGLDEFLRCIGIVVFGWLSSVLELLVFWEVGGQGKRSSKQYKLSILIA